MGIRINKKLGYGLTDVQHDNGRITDPRINVSSRLLVPHEDVARDYLAHLAERRTTEGEKSGAAAGEPSNEWIDVCMEYEAVSLSLEREGHLKPPVTWESEAGWQEMLLVQPLGFPGWSHHDDPIDYLEETELYEPVTPRVVPAPRGIHPFEGLYVDSRDGRRLDSTAKRLTDRLLGKRNDRPDFRRAADHLAKTMGFADAAEAQQLIAPFIPDDVRRLCEWGELFTSPDVWLQLRPMLYVYWA